MRIAEPPEPPQAGDGPRGQNCGRVEGSRLSQPKADDRSELWSAALAERDRAQRVARARCSTPQDAEDCVQEAMARVVAMSDVDVRRVGPLLSTVVANLAADTHRARARAVRAEPRLRAANLPLPSPEEEVCDVLEARWLWGRRDELPEQDRAVLEQRVLGRTAGEAAQALGVTYKAAESAYTRARARMRAIWRAAAALLGILWGRPVRESAPVVVPVAASAAAAVLTVLALVVVPAEDGQAATPGANGAVAPSALVGEASRAVSLSGRPPATQPRPAATVAPKTVPVTPVPASEAGPVRVVPRTAAGPVGAPGVRFEEEREDQSVVESVFQCLGGGLIVSPTRVDCEG
jgi:RNA polymerase sigma factor (sigma-70 family)